MHGIEYYIVYVGGTSFEILTKHYIHESQLDPVSLSHLSFPALMLGELT